MLWLSVAIRVLANPISNVFQKVLAQQGVAAVVVVGVTHGLLTLGCVPLFFLVSFPVATEFWVSISACAALAVAGNAALVQATKTADLSVLGPINSYKAVVSLVPGMLLLGELPSLPALAGVGLIVVGSYGLVDRAGGGGFERFVRDRGVQFRLAALVLSALEAVVLKRAVLAADPEVTFAAWAVLGFVVAMPFGLVLRTRRVRPPREARPKVVTYVLLALTTGLMQYTTIVAFTGLPVAAALALFQTSTLVTVLLGWRVFGEQDVAKRFVGAVVMAAGAVLIVLYR